MNCNLKINKKEYLRLIQEAKYIKGVDGPKRLDAKYLDSVLNKELSAAESLSIKICHKSSKLRDTLTNRRDANHLAAYGNCNFCPKCPVNYNFTIKSIPKGEEYVDIGVEVINQHDHTQPTTQVRGKDRINLGAKIMASNGGSAHEARLVDLHKLNKKSIAMPDHVTIDDSELESETDLSNELTALTACATVSAIPSPAVYRKCKAAFNHKDVPSNDCQINFQYEARSFDNKNESFVHSFNTYK